MDAPILTICWQEILTVLNAVVDPSIRGLKQLLEQEGISAIVGDVLDAHTTCQYTHSTYQRRPTGSQRNDLSGGVAQGEIQSKGSRVQPLF